MKSAQTSSSFFFTPTSTTTTSVTYILRNDRSPSPPPQAHQVPNSVQPSSPQSHSAATKIQSAYRSHLIRSLYKAVSAVDAEADRLERHIQLQETVDSLRGADDREGLKMNESLMALLLRLDSVPGAFDPSVREARRKVSRRIVGLQEVVDAICAAEDGGGVYGWGWDDALAAMEEEVCRERGGEELETFCAQYLGFRCLERFLRES